MFFLMADITFSLMSRNSAPQIPVTDAHTAVCVNTVFSRRLLVGYDSQGYIQEKAAACKCKMWGDGSIQYIYEHACLCSIPFSSCRQTQ